MSDRTVRRFSTEELALFSAASGDRNPLHLEESYARRTAFGQRVVFGMLGALSSIGAWRARRGWRLTELVLEFPSPLLLGVDYVIETEEESADRAAAKVYDGRRLMLRARARFQPAPPPGDPGAASGGEGGVVAAGGDAPGREARDLSPEDLVPDLALRERYAPEVTAMRELAGSMGLADRGVGDSELAVLLGCSYLVGMRLPGRRALFSRLSLKLEGEPGGGNLPLELEARLRAFDGRFSLALLEVTFSGARGPLGRAELQAFVRSDVAPTTTAEIEERLPRSTSLAGRVALVVGASRGLGASIARTLALQGATVLASYRGSHEAASALRAADVEPPGSIRLMAGDAADLRWCQEARGRIERELGGLDLLVCSACPPLLSLGLEASTVERINEYVARSLALVSVPLAVFLEQVAARRGRAILISSSAVSAPPPDWPHYVAAKGAAEGLMHAAAAAYPEASFLVARPPRLLTDLTNTPLGRQRALSPAVVAVEIVRRLLSPSRPGELELLEAFEPC